MEISADFKKLLLASWAIFGCPIFIAAFFQWEFTYSLAKGEMPSSIIPPFVELMVVGIVLLTGITSISLIPKSRNKKILSSILYAVLMVGLIIVLGMWINCINGNCL